MRKIVYLISPNKIDRNFYSSLKKVLSSRNITFFQLRLKKYRNNEIYKIAKKIQKITKKYKVKFIINDNYNLASQVNADGCHLGQSDGPKKLARHILNKKILGITCHNSKKFAKNAVKYNADYLALGSFYQSKLKPNAVKANLKTLKWASKNIKIPVVAIGGINNKNYKNLLKNGAKYIALSSYIWDNPILKPEIAIRNFK